MSVRTSALIVFVALVVALLTSNCGGGGVNPDDGGLPDVTQNACGNPSYTQCAGGVCVDTQGDFQNCGTCGKVCSGDQVCSHGACATVCGGGSSRCGQNCVDLKADPLNCGGCNTKCSGGQVCNLGTCALTCQQGLTNCAGGCVDLTSDDANCNGCGQACATGQQCVNGACQATCQAGWTSCANGDAGTSCVDTASDPNHCGGCGPAYKCANGYFCNNGVCGLNCAGGTSLCSNTCVDENIDPNHCGGCSTVCPNGDVCNSAHCCPNATPYYCGKCDTFANCVLKSGGHIAAGQNHTCAINPSGGLQCWGDGYDGELGNSSSSVSNVPVAVTNLTSGVGSVSSWYYGTCAVTTAGSPYCWGNNPYGQLGNGTTTTSNKPVSVGTITNATMTGGGGYYGANCTVLVTGEIDCQGDDNYGQVAQTTITFTDYTKPQKTVITNALTVAGSANNFYGDLCAVLSTGAVKCWGYSNYGLGDGTSYSGDPVTVSGISTAVQVSVGAENMCVVLQGGTLQCWGYGYYGANGDGTGTTWTTPHAATVTNVVAVSVGSSHTCVVTASGAVQCVGSNGNGQLGNGTTSFSPTTTWQTAISSGAIGIACGSSHSCALLANGHAKCWGYNGYGQLGNGSNTQSTTPVDVSGF